MGVVVGFVEVAVPLEDKENTIEPHTLDGVDFVLPIGLVSIAETDVLFHINLISSIVHLYDQSQMIDVDAAKNVSKRREEDRNVDLPRKKCE